MLGGSLFAHRAQQFQDSESVLFDVTFTVELQQIHARDLNTTCAKAIQIDPERQEEFLFALRAACAQYLRERSIFLVNSNPCTPSDGDGCVGTSLF